MMEQLYLARDRDGVVHVACTQHWRSMLDWNERSSAAEENVEQTLCEESNYFDEVHGTLITCVACIVRAVEVEHATGIQWKEPPT